MVDTFAPPVTDQGYQAPRQETAEVSSFPQDRIQKSQDEFAQLRKRRQQEKETGVPFVLPGDGIEVRVRLLNLHEKSSLIGLPSHIREMMLRGFNEDQMIPPVGKRTEEDMLRIMEIEEKAVNAACIAGFLRPRVWETREEANTNGGIAVDDLLLDDRKAYFSLISGENKEALAYIRNFQRGASSIS